MEQQINFKREVKHADSLEITPTVPQMKLKTEVPPLNTSNVFRPQYTGGIFKIQPSPAILDLCLRETRSRKSRDNRDVIVFGKLRFKNVFRPHGNEKPVFSHSGLKSVFKRKAPPS